MHFITANGKSFPYNFLEEAWQWIHMEQEYVTLSHFTFYLYADFIQGFVPTILIPFDAKGLFAFMKNTILSNHFSALVMQQNALLVLLINTLL